MNSVENVPPTRCVGDSGVTSAGWSRSIAFQFAQQRVELAVGDRRRVQHVVAELVAAQLLGERGVPLADVRRHVLDTFGGRSAGHVGALRGSSSSSLVTGPD